MKKLFFIFAFVALAQLAPANTLLLTVTGTGGTKEQRLALTPGTTLRVSGSGTIEAVSTEDFKTAIGLGSAASKNIGTTAGTVAAGDDSRIVNALQPGKYAVFCIPLATGDHWTDFELKGTTDDFLTDPMIFFYHSPDPAKSVIWQQVWTTRPDVYFTDSGKTGTPNRRAWIKQDATHSIVDMLADANSEVGGFIVIVRDDLSASRPNIVWSYTLMDGATKDNDASGRDIWRPIVPIRWTNDLAPTIN